MTGSHLLAIVPGSGSSDGSGGAVATGVATDGSETAAPFGAVLSSQLADGGAAGGRDTPSSQAPVSGLAAAVAAMTAGIASPAQPTGQPGSATGQTDAVAGWSTTAAPRAGVTSAVLDPQPTGRAAAAASLPWASADADGATGPPATSLPAAAVPVEVGRPDASVPGQPVSGPGALAGGPATATAGQATVEVGGAGTTTAGTATAAGAAPGDAPAAQPTVAHGALAAPGRSGATFGLSGAAAVESAGSAAAGGQPIGGGVGSGGGDPSAATTLAASTDAAATASHEGAPGSASAAVGSRAATRAGPSDGFASTQSTAAGGTIEQPGGAAASAQQGTHAVPPAAAGPGPAHPSEVALPVSTQADGASAPAAGGALAGSGGAAASHADTTARSAEGTDGSAAERSGHNVVMHVSPGPAGVDAPSTTSHGDAVDDGSARSASNDAVAADGHTTASGAAPADAPQAGRDAGADSSFAAWQAAPDSRRSSAAGSDDSGAAGDDQTRADAIGPDATGVDAAAEAAPDAAAWNGDLAPRADDAVPPRDAPAASGPRTSTTVTATEAADLAAGVDGLTARPPDVGRAAEAGPPVHAAASRVLELVARLRNEPPPRQVVVDLSALGAGRVLVALRGDQVVLDHLDGPPADAGWMRDLGQALDARGWSMQDRGRGRDGGGQRPGQPGGWFDTPPVVPGGPGLRSRTTTGTPTTTDGALRL